MKIHGSEIATLLQVNEGVPFGAVKIGDRDYRSPKLSWLLEDFATVLGAWCWKLDLAYSDSEWDCEDFADFYSLLARAAHRQTPGNKGYGLPVGCAHGMLSISGAHAIVMAHTSDHGIVWIEPQTGGRIHPTRKQLESIWLIKF